MAPESYFTFLPVSTYRGAERNPHGRDVMSLLEILHENPNAYFSQSLPLAIRYTLEDMCGDLIDKGEIDKQLTHILHGENPHFMVIQSAFERAEITVGQFITITQQEIITGNGTDPLKQWNQSKNSATARQNLQILQEEYLQLKKVYTPVSSSQSPLAKT